MNENLLFTIKNILDKECLNTDQLALELNNTILKLEVREQAELHGELSKKQLTRLYTVLDSISIESSAKEHIIWYYFRQKCEENSSEFLNTELIHEIVDSYKNNKFLALESLIIDALKSEKVNPELLLFLEGNFSSKAFNKELQSYKCREIVGKGGKLNIKQISKLLEFRSYATLDYALDQNAITKEGLLGFSKPVDHENDRKAKDKLYNKAQNQLHIDFLG